MATMIAKAMPTKIGSGNVPDAVVLVVITLVMVARRVLALTRAKALLGCGLVVRGENLLHRGNRALLVVAGSRDIDRASEGGAEQQHAKDAPQVGHLPAAGEGDGGAELLRQAHQPDCWTSMQSFGPSHHDLGLLHTAWTRAFDFAFKELLREMRTSRRRREESLSRSSHGK
jgi:hypothetical protein